MDYNFKKKMYKISFVTPFYNNISEAIKNCEKFFKYVDVQFVFVGMDENIIKRSEKNVKIQYIDTSIYEAMNFGSKFSNAEYIYFKGATDNINVTNILNDLDGTSFIIGRVNIGSKVRGYKILPRRINYIHHQAVILKKEFCSFDLSYMFFSDLDLINRVIKSNVSTKFVKQIFCDFQIGGFSTNTHYTIKKILELSKISLKFDRFFFLSISYWLNVLRLIYYKIK